MKPFALKARYLLTMDGRPPIENGIVTIADERIVAVGENLSGKPAIDLADKARESLGISRGLDKPATDACEVALLPGFVNAHTHLEFSELSYPLGEPGMSLPNWIREVIKYRWRQANDPRMPKPLAPNVSAVMAGLSKGVDVTTVGDIATQTPNLDDYSKFPFFHADVVIFSELLGLPIDRLSGLFERAESHRVHIDEHARSPGKVMPHMVAGLSPHAPYSVHPAVVRMAAELSHRQGNVPLAMHIAESREELELLAVGTGPFREFLEERGVWEADAIPLGSRPLDYLQMLSRGSRALIVHGNYLEPDELEFIAQHRDRMSLVYCPRTHYYFRHEPYPLELALKLGVPVAIGTDSLASNPDLSMLAELRFLAHRFPQLSAEAILHLGTTCGARALGFEQSIGTIEPGKLANLVAIDLQAKWGNPYERIMYEDSQHIATWYRGKHATYYSVRKDGTQGSFGIIDEEDFFL